MMLANMIRMTRTRSAMVIEAFLLSLVMSVGYSVSQTVEPIPIGRVVADAQSYHLHMVILQGTVQKVMVLNNYFNFRIHSICYDAYVFTLEDKTGSIDVEVPGVCTNVPPEIKPPQFSNGDRVLIQAVINAPGLSAGEGYSISGIDPSKVRAMAREVTKVKE